MTEWGSVTRLVDVTVALSSYDHTRELTNGSVAIAGTRPNFIELPIPEMFRRFVKFREWDVSEISFVKYAMLRSSGDDGIIAIPVFTSRMFRHSAIYVRSDRVEKPADLRGARVGIPEWTNSAGVWARGLLCDMHDLSPWDVEWWQGGVDRPGRPGVLDAPALPDHVKLHRVADRSLEDMLWAGDLEALIAPAIPQSLLVSAASGGLIRRLFDDLPREERAYWEATRCLPLMHTVAIRRELLETYPWLASNLYRAFEVAKRRYFSRLTEISASRVPIPRVTAYLAEAKATFGDDLWPYGVEANRASLDVFLRYGAQQGLFEKPLAAADLFVPVEPFVDGMT
jgi:4,5-dihydroxyphthalate decarboxylase